MKIAPKILLSIALCWMAAAVAQQQQKPATASQPKPAAVTPASDRAALVRAYELGTGDVVRINVFQQPDMTTETRVSDLGTITFPLLGPVEVAGSTTKQAEARIAALLKARGFVREPQVTMTILAFKSKQFSVLGYVNRPGRYSLEDGSYFVTDALALASGIIVGSGADKLTLIRQRDGKTLRFDIDIPSLFKSGDFSLNLEVISGDTLYVDKAPLFYIYGEVQRPGAFRLESEMTVMQALSVGGGLTLRGTERNVKLTRRGANGKLQVLEPKLTDPLQADDVINVKESVF